MADPTPATIGIAEIERITGPVAGDDAPITDLSGGGSGSGGSTLGSEHTTSGDGTTTSFTIPHSLESVPSAVSVAPASEDASTDFWVSSKSSTDLTITYGRAPPTGTDNLTFEVAVTGETNDFASQVTKSGDGSTASFTVTHSLGSVPSVVSMTPASEDASTDFWVSSKSSTDLTITFARAPPTGTDNLAFEVYVAV